MSTINATPGAYDQPTALIKSSDGTANLTLQTNSISAVVITQTKTLRLQLQVQ